MFNTFKNIISKHSEISNRLETLEDSIFEHFRFSEESKAEINIKMQKLERNVNKITTKIDAIIDKTGENNV